MLCSLHTDFVRGFLQRYEKLYLTLHECRILDSWQSPGCGIGSDWTNVAAIISVGDMIVFLKDSKHFMAICRQPENAYHATNFFVPTSPQSLCEDEPEGIYLKFHSHELKDFVIPPKYWEEYWRTFLWNFKLKFSKSRSQSLLTSLRHMLDENEDYGRNWF